MQRWASRDKLIALTNGAEGATAYFAGETHHVPGRVVNVVDTVAAGDTFTAGLLDGLLRAGMRTSLAHLSASDVVAAVERAVAAAAITCTRTGPNPPYAPELGD